MLMTPILSARTTLTIDKVRLLAMDHNRQLQSARKELDRARGEIISARSGALPQISLDGTYTRNIEVPELFFGGQAIPIGLNNDFNLALSLTQPIYNGGKAYTAWKIAKIYEKYNPLKNLIWDPKKKAWKNHKLFGPRFEYLYPDLDYHQKEEIQEN